MLVKAKKWEGETVVAFNFSGISAGLAHFVSNGLL